MEGRVCLVTGTTSGMGRVVALELARMGATVVMSARDPTRGAEAAAELRALSENGSVDLLVADLAVLREVRQLAAQFRARYSQLHVLVNNAGTIFPPCGVTEDGLDRTFTVNHLAPFLLTNLLLDLLKASAPARIVNLASVAHSGGIEFSSVRRGEPQPGFYRAWRSYKQSKLANVVFTYELARRLEGTGVTVNCLHPGMVATNAGKDSRGLAGVFLSRLRPLLIGLLLRLPHTFLLRPEEGAGATLFLASSPEVEDITGRYFVGKVESRSAEESYDRSLAERLWRFDSELVGLESPRGSVGT